MLDCSSLEEIEVLGEDERHHMLVDVDPSSYYPDFGLEHHHIQTHTNTLTSRRRPGTGSLPLSPVPHLAPVYTPKARTAERRHSFEYKRHDPCQLEFNISSAPTWSPSSDSSSVFEFEEQELQRFQNTASLEEGKDAKTRKPEDGQDAHVEDAPKIPPTLKDLFDRMVIFDEPAIAEVDEHISSSSSSSMSSDDPHLFVPCNSIIFVTEQSVPKLVACSFDTSDEVTVLPPQPPQDKSVVCLEPPVQLQNAENPPSPTRNEDEETSKNNAFEITSPMPFATEPNAQNHPERRETMKKKSKSRSKFLKSMKKSFLSRHSSA
jgi:hypothetical protein